MHTPRQKAADACLAAFDTEWFKALCEPARIEIIRRLVLVGRADIGDIAEDLPQDRSVISRHLQFLERINIVSVERVGRHVYYQLNGPALVEKLETVLALTRPLVPFCCPGPENDTVAALSDPGAMKNTEEFPHG